MPVRESRGNHTLPQNIAATDTQHRHRSKQQIVISGIACRFPESDNIQEFWDNLVGSVDMVTDDNRRWTPGLFGLPRRNGKLKHPEHFDAQFFGIPPKQVHKLDPQLRILLEVGYDALLDAGLLPQELRGSNTGVYIGACYSDAQAIFASFPEKLNGYETTGCALSMFANRLSFHMDFHGPSLTIDTACSSSLVALDAAVNAIDTGLCDHALVGGSNLLLRPSSSLAFERLNMLAPDGKSKSFDDSANGYVRSEGVGVIVVSRADMAKRVYASILATGVNNDGYADDGITFPNSAAQQQLLRRIYESNGLNYADVTYIEAHGTGTPAGDPQEIDAIDKVFCHGEAGSTRRLLIGSVKSNIGHLEGGAGVAGIIKVLLSAQHGLIPANLHYRTANRNIPALLEQRIKVVDAHTPWQGGCVGINSFGVGGTNAHVVLDCHVATKTLQEEPEGLAVQFVPVFAQTEAGLEAMLDRLRDRLPLSPRMVGHMKQIADADRSRFPCRGGLLLSGEDAVESIFLSGAPLNQRPVWLVFSGMGSQWSAMAKSLLVVPACRDALHACSTALEDTGMDLISALVDPDSGMAASPILSFVGITAIQIALLAFLDDYGVRADGCLGHSVGEIAAAYHDGAISLAQAMRIAYYRGLSIEETPQARGAMAVVNKTWDEACVYEERGISAACHNSLNSVTLSGPEHAIRHLVNELENREEFVRLVSSAGIAFHSPLIQPAAEKFRNYLHGVIDSQRPRSARWLSTSENDGVEPASCLQEYFINNLINPVNFYNALRRLPSDAIVIEVGPHSLLRASVHQTLAQVTYIPMMLKEQDNNISVHRAIGELYAAGVEIGWPLSPPETRLEENFILPVYTDWQHTGEWEVPNGEDEVLAKSSAASFSYTIDTNQAEFAYIRDHSLNHKIVIPGMCYVYLAWKSLAQRLGKNLEQTRPIVRDVRFLRPVIIGASGVVDLKLSLLSETGEFQILHDDELVARGTVGEHELEELDIYKPHECVRDSERLTREQFYKELHLRGYTYGESFRDVESVTLDGLSATLRWTGNWVSFLDGLLQFGIVREERKTIIPTYIRELRICPEFVTGRNTLAAILQASIERVWSQAVVINGGRFSQTASQQISNPAKLMRFEFMPFYESRTMDMPGQEQAKRCFETTNNFIVSQAIQLIETSMASDTALPAHIPSLYKALKSVTCRRPEQNALAELRQHPKALLLRLAEHVFGQGSGLLNNAMPSIVSFKEHAELYENDYIAAYFNDQRLLGGLLKIFYENLDGISPVKVCEIGTGTGGMTGQVLSSLRTRMDRYIISDVSAGFFENLKDKFSEYDSVTEYCVWDIRQPAPEDIGDDCDLIVANNVLHAASNIREALGHVRTALRDNGFLLIFEQTHGFGVMLGIWGFIADLWQYTDERDNGPLLSHQGWLKLLDEQGFELVCCRDSGYSGTLYLCRKRKTHRHHEIMRFTTGKGVVESLAKALKESSDDPDARLWLQGDLEHAPGLLGLSNCARKEPNSARLRTIYIDQASPPPADKLIARQRYDMAVNVYRDNQWGSYGFFPLPRVEDVISENAYVKVDVPGDLSTLHWATAPAPAEQSTLVRARALSLNFKDLMLASGKLAPEAFAGNINDNIGGEFAGVTEAGERVMGFVQSPLANLVKISDDDLVQIYTIPEQWSFAEAATIPVAYLTAYYALCIKAAIQPGQRVLIHSGTSSVGQAAIRIALSKGCEIYTTVGSDSKREYINKHFPRIDDDHIASSRNIGFESQFMQLSNGEGMDVVLNSLAGEQLFASVRLTARYGVFLEIGKYDMIANTALGMEVMLREVSLHGVGVNNLMLDDKQTLARLQLLLKEGIESGVVVPLPLKCFASDQIENAFRYLSSGRHIGKVVIALGDDMSVSAGVTARPEFWCHPDKSYLITGGLGGFGLELAEWLVAKGAKYLVLTSRNGIRDNYQRYRVNRWIKSGVSVTISRQDVGIEEQTQALLEKTQLERPIGGIFHLAMVMEDALLVNQDSEKFRRVCKVKLDGCRYLDLHSRHHCPELDQFVAFSSLSGAAGNPGQASYGYANFGMDRICEQRKQEGYPALAIQWGSIGDVGFVSEHKDRVNIKSLGADDQSLASCLQALETFLSQDAPVVSSYVPYSDIKDDKSTQDNRKTVSEQTLVADIKKILGIPSDQKLDEGRSLFSVGMDSLMSVELQVKLEKDYGVYLKLDAMRELTVADLKAQYRDLQNRQPLAATAETLADNGPPQAWPLFDTLNDPANANLEVLFLSGTAVDPRPLLAEMEFPDNLKLTVVNYEVCENISEFSRQLLQYLNRLDEQLSEIKLVGYSTGALALLRALHISELGQSARNIKTIAISPPRPEIYAELQQVSPEVIEAINEAEALSRFSSMPWFGEFDKLPFDMIRHQFRFMTAEPFFEESFGQVDEIILPNADMICWDREKAMNACSKISEPDGKHDLRSLKLQDILLA